MKLRSPLFLSTAMILLLGLSAFKLASAPQEGTQVLHGQGTLDGWQNERPGNQHLITAGDLPKPAPSQSAVAFPKVVPRGDAMPQVPSGFKIDLFATGFDNPRGLITAPNGDIFVTESNPGRLRVLRGVSKDGKVAANQVFTTGLSEPYGVAFYPPGPNPQYVYVANTLSAVRFPYQNGDTKARGPSQTVVENLPYGGAHWTRDIVFSPDGKKMYIAVGSRTNVDDSPEEKNRANVLEFNADGSGQRIYASGIRNPSGLTINPSTNQLWVAANERDGLGDNLPPDYVTHISDGGFYGWPWYYIGGNQDPRHAGAHPELKDKVTVPDVLIQSHSAPLQLRFYTGMQFPPEYRGDIFVASHGSWNRGQRTGYSILRVRTPNGKSTGVYEEFVTGFVHPDGNVWGRPVGVTIAADGSLIFSDDGTGSVWRVTYAGK